MGVSFIQQHMPAFTANAKDFGAVGNGVKDDTIALNAALASVSGNGTVLLPAASYLISAPLRVKAHTTILAHGTTITLASYSSCNMLQNWGVQANRRIVDGVTNSTTTFTSATASFVAGDVGTAIRIYYQDGTYLDTTVASVTNSTTAVLSTAATTSQTGLYAYLGAGRDSNIRVFGGTWVRNTNNYTGGTNGWDSNSLRFRHVDNLIVGEVTMNNQAGKYCVNVGDCSDFSIHDVTTLYSVSDTVHVNGPAWWGTIERIASYGSADDIVSLTGADFHNQAQWMGDCLGNITDITIDGVMTVPSLSGGTTRGVLLLAGQSSSLNPYLIDRITVRDMRTQLANYPVFIGTDVQDTYTQGGTWGRILIDRGINVSSAPPGGFVRVTNGSTVNELEARSVFDIGATTYVWIETGATVNRLVTIGVQSSYVSMQGTVTTADIIESPVTIATAQTITGNKTFTGTTQMADVTVVPNAGQGTSATVFLNNQQPTPQIWQFNCASDGSFQIYDQTGGHTVFKADTGVTTNNAVEIANGSYYIRETLRLSSPFVSSSSMQFQHVSKTANYTANANTDLIIGIGTLTAAITITLPSITWAGQMFLVKDEAGGAATYNVTIAGSGGQLIDGAASIVMSTNYGVVRLYSTGSGWSVW